MTAITLIAEASRRSHRASDLPPGYRHRPMCAEDIPALGNLYFAAYDPGVACDTLEEAVADIRASFAGEYGNLWLEASPVVTWNDQIVAAIMTVRRAPWNDVPECPFITELFIDRSHRRRGLARTLLMASLKAAYEHEESAIALRVDPSNDAALTLYAAAGFMPWKEKR
ncbi:MAG: GNAT family N-acetyltransferase [Thermomicrobiales bacterium]